MCTNRENGEALETERRKTDFISVSTQLGGRGGRGGGGGPVGALHIAAVIKWYHSSNNVLIIIIIIIGNL